MCSVLLHGTKSQGDSSYVCLPPPMAGGSLDTDSSFDTREASAVSLNLLDLCESKVLFNLTNTSVRSSSQRCLKCHHLL